MSLCHAISCFLSVAPWRMQTSSLQVRQTCHDTLSPHEGSSFRGGPRVPDRQLSDPCLRSIACIHTRTYRPVSTWVHFMTCPHAMSCHQVLLRVFMSGTITVLDARASYNDISARLDMDSIHDMPSCHVMPPSLARFRHVRLSCSARY